MTTLLQFSGGLLLGYALWSSTDTLLGMLGAALLAGGYYSLGKRDGDED